MLEQPAPIWTAQDIQAAWENGAVVAQYNPVSWRKDACGAWISRKEHGNSSSSFGWEVTHLALKANEVADHSNLRPLQWKNAAADKNDGSLTCPVSAYGGGNI